MRRFRPCEIGCVGAVTLPPRAPPLQAEPSSGALTACRLLAYRTNDAVHFISEGDFRLAKLKQQLVRTGDSAEFASGVLHVNKTVSVRKTQPNVVAVEGAFGADYLRVRQALYSQFTVI